MQRLSNAVKDIVGYIHNVVYGALTDDGEPVTQPFGAFAHFDAAYCDTAVARTRIVVGNLNRNSSGGSVSLEPVCQRFFQRRCHRMARKPCAEVAGYTVMARSVDTVRGQVNFKNIVA